MMHFFYDTPAAFVLEIIIQIIIEKQLQNYYVLVVEEKKVED